MSHVRPARSPLAFVLGPMRGTRAPAIVAMNSRASSLQAADVSTLDSPWSVIGPAMWMRLVTRGHYGDIGTLQIRVAGAAPATVPLISSIGYGRCTPQLTTQGSTYARTQPLSFEALRSASQGM